MDGLLAAQVLSGC